VQILGSTIDGQVAALPNLFLQIGNQGVPDPVLLGGGNDDQGM
jgi:hypothetical protein